jgi:hypothetical protein
VVIRQHVPDAGEQQGPILTVGPALFQLAACRLLYGYSVESTPLKQPLKEKAPPDLSRCGAMSTEAEGLEPPRVLTRLISNQLPYQLDYASKSGIGAAVFLNRGDRI